jgi:hypothetical protein
MKWYWSTGLLLIIIFVTVSCSQKKNNSSETSSYNETHSKITVEYIGGIELVKSFSFIQSTTLSKKEIEKMMEETEKENPINQKPADSAMRKKFEKLGFVKDVDLLPEKLKYSSKPDTFITSPIGTELRIRIKKDTINGRDSKVIVYTEKDSMQIKINIYLKLQYALLDVVPGGNKELVILNEYYLANNYLYDFDVYEIKTG